MYARLFLALPLAMILACGVGGGDDPPDATINYDASPSCLEAEGHSDLAWLQANVFTPSCAAFTSCHRGTASQAAMLNMEDGNTETNLVDRFARSEGIDSQECLLLSESSCNASETCVWNPEAAGSCEGLTIVVAISWSSSTTSREEAV